MTNYRVNLAFSEASFEMIIVITPEKEADPYNGQFSFDHTIATEKSGPIYFGIFFNATNTAIYGERFPGFHTISRKSSCLSQRLIVVAVVIAISQHGGCQWFPYDPNDQWTFFPAGRGNLLSN